MKTPVKIALGLAGISPFPCMIVIMGAFIYYLESHPNNIGPFITEYDIYINLGFILLGLCFSAVQVFYIVHAAKNPNIEVMRVTWILSIFFLGAFAMPIYWFHHIWREGKDSRSSGLLGLTGSGGP